jgi:hypothetical protein
MGIFGLAGSDHNRSYFLERALSLTPLLAALVGMLALSILQELRLGLWDDVTHLIDLSGRLLDGERPYVDFPEFNPPASILIYVPPTELARLLGFPVDLMTQVFVFVGAGVSVAFCIRLANASDTARDLGEVGLLGTVAALFVLPACAFAQRDHIALIAALPMLVVMGIRASGRRVGALSATVAGLGGGLMVTIRPHYAAALGLAALYVAWRRGLRSCVVFPEFYSAGLVGVAYLIAILLFFPGFLSDAMPMALALYAPLKLDPRLLLVTPTALIWITLALLVLAYRRQVVASPFAAVASLSSAGAYWSYMVQGKAFPYHGYVALALAFLAVALVLAKPQRGSFSAMLALAIGFCIAMFANMATGIWSVEIAVAMLIAAIITFTVTFLPESFAFKDVHWSLVSLGVFFVAFGQAHAAHEFRWRKDPIFLAEARQLGRPKLALVSEDGGLVEFLADRVGSRWPQHYSLAIIDAVDFLLERGNVDEATRQKLEAYRQRQQDLFLKDIDVEKPDAIIVDQKWAEAHVDPTALRNILKDYRLVSTAGSGNSRLDPILQFFVR